MIIQDIFIETLNCEVVLDLMPAIRVRIVLYLVVNCSIFYYVLLLRLLALSHSTCLYLTYYVHLCINLPKQIPRTCKLTWQ